MPIKIEPKDPDVVVDTTVRVKIERIDPEEFPPPETPPQTENPTSIKPLIKVRENLGCNHVDSAITEKSPEPSAEAINNVQHCSEDSDNVPITPTTETTNDAPQVNENLVEPVTKESHAQNKQEVNTLPSSNVEAESAPTRSIKTELNLPEDEMADCKMEAMSPESQNIPDEYYDRAYNLRPRSETSVNYVETMEWQASASTSYLPKPVQQTITPWKCDPCQFYFVSKDALKIHQKSQQCKGFGQETFHCRVCAKMYFDERELAQHNLNHLRIAQNMIPEDCRACSKCGSLFADQQRFRLHARQHLRKTAPPALVLACCGKKFIKKSVYDDHMKTHNQEPTIPTVTKVEEVQEENRDIACSLCIGRFKSEDLLYDHRFAMHGIPDERVACNVCTQKFRSPDDLEEHTQSHQIRSVARKSTSAPVAVVAPTKIKCRRCGISFQTRTHLLRHEAEKHKSLHNCVRCKRRFATRSLLLMHLRTHKKKTQAPLTAQYIIGSDGSSDVPAPDPKQIANLVCSTCDLLFGCSEDIDLHVGTHDMIGVNAGRIRHLLDRSYYYQCPKCPQMFMEVSGVQRHSAIRHFGSRVNFIETQFPVKRAGLGAGTFVPASAPLPEALSFPCPECSGKFGSAAVLNFHLRKKHQEGENTEKEFVNCKICDRRYATTYIEKHMTFDHGILNKKRKSNIESCYVSTRKKIFKCRFCPKSCSTTFNLKKHESSHDAKTGEFKCSCGALFKTQSQAYDHKKHCTRKVYRGTAKPVSPTPQGETCNVCFQSYETSQLLQLHVSTAHGLGVPTENPSKELWREERNKIIRKVNGMLRCTLCRLPFNNNEEVSWHQGQHARGNAYIIQLDECLFQCTVCGKLFKQREDGLNHISAHAEPESSSSTAEISTKYNCPFCRMKFNREEAIRSHIHSQHPGDSSKRIM